MLAFSSCYKKPVYSIVPQISIASADMVHLKPGVDSVNFVVNYQDGDGDIGLGQQDTLPPFNQKSYYYTDMYIYYLEKQNGQFVPVYNTFLNIDTIKFTYRIPLINDSKRSQPISGNFSLGILINYPTIYKTIKFRIFIFDRALHQSNIIETAPMERG